MQCRLCILYYILISLSLPTALSIPSLSPSPLSLLPLALSLLSLCPSSHSLLPLALSLSSPSPSQRSLPPSALFLPFLSRSFSLSQFWQCFVCRFLQYWLSDMVEVPYCWSVETAIAVILIPLIISAASW